MATDAQAKAAKEYAKRVGGYHGRQGGWIYSNLGTPLFQGWSRVYSRHAREINDTLAKTLTAFGSFDALVNAPNYRPTLIKGGRGGWRYEALADAYDQTQRSRGDSRRAYRG
jgi:hypothetical protein